MTRQTIEAATQQIAKFEAAIVAAETADNETLASAIHARLAQYKAQFRDAGVFFI